MAAKTKKERATHVGDRTYDDKHDARAKHLATHSATLNTLTRTPGEINHTAKLRPITAPAQGGSTACPTIPTKHNADPRLQHKTHLVSNASACGVHVTTVVNNWARSEQRTWATTTALSLNQEGCFSVARARTTVVGNGSQTQKAASNARGRPHT